MNEMGGLGGQTPILACFFAAATFATIGLPGFGNFWGEFAIFLSLGSKDSNFIFLVLAALGIIISAIFGLRAMARIFYGTKSDEMIEYQKNKKISDLRSKEILPAAVILLPLLLLGLWPKSVSDGIDTNVSSQLSILNEDGRGSYALPPCCPPPGELNKKPFPRWIHVKRKMEVMTKMEAFQIFAEDNMWRQIWPELSLVLGAVLVLLVDLFGSKGQKNSSLSGSLAILIQLFLLVYHLLDYLLINHTFERSSFSGMLCHGFRDVARTFFLLASLCVSIMGNRYLFLNRSRVGEFHHLTMVATAGLMLLCQSNNFIVLFVALETVALAFYPLVAYNTNSEKSLEAGLKYLIFGALSSALLLLGIVFLYGVGSNPEAWGASVNADNSMDYLSFEYVGDLLFHNPDNLFLRGGVVLILAGLAFKIGAALFKFGLLTFIMVPPRPLPHFWPFLQKQPVSFCC